VKIVVEAEAVGLECGVEGLFAGVAKGGVTDVVDQGESFSQLRIEAKCAGQGSGDLRDFQGVGETAAEVISGWVSGQPGKDLGFAGEAAKCPGMQNPGSIAGKGGAVGVRRLGVGAACQVTVRIAADGNCRRQLV
jgi:hypothetical protein